MNEAVPTSTEQRREDFPIDVFRHMESRIGEIRKALMELAAQKASARSPDGGTYQVESGDIDAAWDEILQPNMPSQ